MRILLDKNVPVGVRRFLSDHEVRTVAEMNWPPQLGNSELLDAAEASGFDLIVTADQSIKYQQNLSGRKLALCGAGLEHLACSTEPWRRDCGENQCRKAGKLRLHRDAAPAQAAELVNRIDITSLCALRAEGLRSTEQAENQLLVASRRLVAPKPTSLRTAYEDSTSGCRPEPCRTTIGGILNSS